MRISKDIIKRLISLLLTATTLLLTFSLAACNDQSPNESTPAPSSPKNDENNQDPNDSDSSSDDNKNNGSDSENNEDNDPDDTDKVEDTVSLDGKRVIFIGNSHTYYGKTVVYTSDNTQAARENDQGMFYHLCRLNGAKFSVTNWTFANHDLIDTFGTCAKCSGGADHKTELKNSYYDYVILQEGSSKGTPETFLAIFEEVYSFFKASNPNAKFILTLSTRAIRGNYAWLSAVEGLKESHDLTVLYLGNMIWDVVDGKTAVPGATQSFIQNSFIICKSSTDGYHPNLLTGYLTSLFVYCAITGESAVDQPYSFAINSNVNPEFDHTSFISKYYTYKNPYTNFDLILKSEADMKGLQQLVDKYLENKN